MSQQKTKYAVKFHINIEGNDIDDVEISYIDYLEKPTMEELSNAANRQLSHYHISNYQIVAFMDGDNECDQDEDVEDAWHHWLDISDDEEDIENMDSIQPLTFNIILTPKTNVNTHNIASDDLKQSTQYPVVFQIFIQDNEGEQMCNIQYLPQPQIEELKNAIIRQLSDQEIEQYTIKSIMDCQGIDLEDDDDVETAFDALRNDNTKPNPSLFLKVMLMSKETGDEKKKNIVNYLQLLQSWNLIQFADKFANDGWDDPLDWKELTDDELRNDIGFGRGHIIRFRKKYKEWLKLSGNDYEEEEKKMDQLLNMKSNIFVWKPTPSVDTTYSALTDMGFSHELSMKAARKNFNQLDEAVSWIIQENSKILSSQDIKEPEPGSKQMITTQYELPQVNEFIIPNSIMRQRDTRCIKDIVMCFTKNNISIDAISKFEQFVEVGHYNYVDIETNLIEIMDKFKQKHGDLIVFSHYVEKCIYELSPPLFRACKFVKKDEDNMHAYFEKQCKGVIKHDRSLLQYFCITNYTESELSSQLIDITDRIAFEEKQELNLNEFGKRYFFKNVDRIQISKIKTGLRRYHSRFLPKFPKNPLKLVVDKIGGYQKYCILLSFIIDEITTRISSKQISYFDNMMPFMIDLMILPPGCFNKVEDENTKTYDCSGPEKIGDIAKRLKAFDIPIYTTRGLNDKPKNFDTDIAQRMARTIIESIKKLTNNLKKNQRICILVDRRWRINCKTFDAFNKLIQYRDNNN
eukprot:446430_1